MADCCDDAQALKAQFLAQATVYLLHKAVDATLNTSQHKTHQE